MREIRLINGLVSLVDECDFDQLLPSLWFQIPSKGTTYAGRSILKNGRHTTERMHRVIMNPLPGIHVDHIDRCGLHNYRSNLRLVTPQLNNFNRCGEANCTSKYKGVSWITRAKSWRVQIFFNGKKISLGYFKDEVEAARTYDAAAAKYFRSHAFLNFPGVSK